MRFPLLLRRVSGESMLPTLKPGQLVIGFRSNRWPKTGDIIIFRHQGIEKIKRVTSVSKTGNFEVLGDNNKSSTDSRTFGDLKVEVIVAKLLTLKRP
jgi:signal peptidase I